MYFSEYLKCSEFKFLGISNLNFYRTTALWTKL